MRIFCPELQLRTLCMSRVFSVFILLAWLIETVTQKLCVHSNIRYITKQFRR